MGKVLWVVCGIIAVLWDFGWAVFMTILLPAMSIAAATTAETVYQWAVTIVIGIILPMHPGTKSIFTALERDLHHLREAVMNCFQRAR